MAGPPRLHRLAKAASCARSAGDAHAKAGIGASVRGWDEGVNCWAMPMAPQAGCMPHGCHGGLDKEGLPQVPVYLNMQYAFTVSARYGRGQSHGQDSLPV